MKKAVFGIIAFLIVFNFAVKVPAVYAAEGQPDQIDAQSAAYLTQALTILNTILADVELRLASPNGSQLGNKEAIGATLVAIKSSLVSINGTLAALKIAPTVAKSPVETPKTSAVQAEESPVAAVTQDKTPEAVSKITIPPVTELPTPAVEAPAADNEAAPQTARVSEGFDYRKLAWPAIFALIGTAAIGLWLFRKDDEEVMKKARTASAVIHSSGEQKLPVELPVESLFPQTEPAAYSPLRSVVSPAHHAPPHPAPRNPAHSAEAPITPQYKPVFLTEKPAAAQKPVIHPPAFYPHAPKEHEQKNN